MAGNTRIGNFHGGGCDLTSTTFVVAGRTHFAAAVAAVFFESTHLWNRRGEDATEDAVLFAGLGFF